MDQSKQTKRSKQFPEDLPRTRVTKKQLDAVLALCQRLQEAAPFTDIKKSAVVRMLLKLALEQAARASTKALLAEIQQHLESRRPV